MSIAAAIALFPLKLIATVILYLIKIVFSTVSFLVFAFSLPFVKLAEILGGLLLLITSVGIGAMLLCWYFGSVDGKTVLVVGCTFGLVSALLFASEDIAGFIYDKLEDASFFIDDLIEDMWQ